MEGLTGTAIRSAVRDPSCPQAPVFPGARRLRVLVRGCSCRWLRPRPPIPPRTTVSGQAARRVARSAAGTGAPDLTSGIKSRASPGITGTSCTRQILPVSTKASPARLEAGMDPAGRPAVLTKGSQPWTALAVACHVPIRLEGRTRTLSGPSPDLSPARTLAPSARRAPGPALLPAPTRWRKLRRRGWRHAARPGTIGGSVAGSAGVREESHANCACERHRHLLRGPRGR